MDTPERRAESAITAQQIAIYDELKALLPGERGQALGNRLAELSGALGANYEDHVLRIAGRLCMEYGQTELWEQIYREAREGCHVALGDEMVFLDETPKPDAVGGEQPG